MRFTKMHGIGNDYIYVHCPNGLDFDPHAVALALSPRHTSVGSDGIIFNEGLVTVGKNAFASCTRIDFIQFSSSMTGVDVYAFGLGQMVELVIPFDELYEQYSELFKEYAHIEIRRD